MYSVGTVDEIFPHIHQRRLVEATSLQTVGLCITIVHCCIWLFCRTLVRIQHDIGRNSRPIEAEKRLDEGTHDRHINPPTVEYKQ